MDESNSKAAPDARRRPDPRLNALQPPFRIPAGVWALGIVSLFMDTSSELIHSLLPAFIVSVLGASALSLGLIDGVAEATAAITKLFSGALSDYLGRRKLLIVLGYGLAALSKPLFPMAVSVKLVFTARFVDRIGKGLRGAPRDALIGDITPREIRNASYGLRQSLDTVGAFAGPLAAVAAMAVFSDDVRTVFWLAVAPALVSLLVLLFAVKEPARLSSTRGERIPIHWDELEGLGRVYWSFLAVSAVLGLARFSEGFLILHAGNVGLPLTLVPLVLVGMNVAYAASSYPAGLLADRTDQMLLLALGFVFLVAADVTLGAAQNIWVFSAGVLLWGLHMGFTQGLMAAFVANAAPESLRGTAFGVFNLVNGLTLLAASALAGLLWDRYSPPVTFFAGGVIASLALAGLWIVLYGAGRTRAH